MNALTFLYHVKAALDAMPSPEIADVTIDSHNASGEIVVDVYTDEDSDERREYGEKVSFVIRTGDIAATECQPDEDNRPRPFEVEGSATERPGPRIIGRYTPQVWHGDYAVSGTEQRWDVTDLLLSMFVDDLLNVSDHSETSDWIVHDYSAHEGPHEVVVESAIEAFFREVTGDEAFDYRGSLTEEIMSLARDTVAKAAIGA